MTEAAEVIDNYLLWELCKQRDIKRIIIEESPDPEELEDIVEEARQEYRGRNYDYDGKLNLLRKLDSNPGYRSEILEGCSWSRETVDIDDLGTTLPCFGDLPPEVISGSLPEVVEFVREADPEQYRSVKYIMSLKQLPEIMEEFLPWIVTPGNRPSKRDRMEKVHGEKYWNIEDTWGIINDGNHRTVAKILANDLEEIECFVGRRQTHADN